ncbi:MAG: hypothetical protein ABMA64_20030, partial [Myxococcota bacterium]
PGVVAWTRAADGFSELEVRQWSGGGWSDLGVAAVCAGRCGSIDVARGGGKVCVAWTEAAGLGVRCAAP